MAGSCVSADDPSTSPPSWTRFWRTSRLRRRTARTAASPTDWLMPGRKHGTHVTAEELRRRLQVLDLPVRPGRRGALLALASELPAAVLAEHFARASRPRCAMDPRCRTRLRRLRGRPDGHRPPITAATSGERVGAHSSSMPGSGSGRPSTAGSRLLQSSHQPWPLRTTKQHFPPLAILQADRTADDTSRFGAMTSSPRIARRASVVAARSAARCEPSPTAARIAGCHSTKEAHVPQRLTIFTIPGDPDKLFEFKHAVIDQSYRQRS